MTIHFACPCCGPALQCSVPQAGAMESGAKCQPGLKAPPIKPSVQRRRGSLKIYLIVGVAGMGLVTIAAVAILASGWVIFGQRIVGEAAPQTTAHPADTKDSELHKPAAKESAVKVSATNEAKPQQLKEPISSETPDPLIAVPAPAAGKEPRLLKAADLVYKGSFAPPKAVNGLYTSYTQIALAMRIVKGKRQFFAGAGPYAGPYDPGVYEMDFPGLSEIKADNRSWPQANVLKWWGDIWQGKCILTDNTPIIRRGLYWDEPLQRLYWTYGANYPASGANDPCFGCTDLSGPTLKAHGPFGVTGGAVGSTDKTTRAVNSACQGGITRLPKWFAKRYTNNQSLGLGFGGYYNIISSGVSMGPALFAIDDPEDGTKDYRAIPCVAHTYVVNAPPGAHYCKRSSDYTGDGAWAAPFPVKGIGYWTAMDTIMSACCWVDLPDVSGLLVMANISKGTINYEVMNRRAEGGGSDNWLYVYDPTDLAAVATGTKNPWEIDPASMTVFPTPLGGRINGMVFEASSRTLFVLATWAYQDGYEGYPLIHAYQEK